MEKRAGEVTWVAWCLDWARGERRAESVLGAVAPLMWWWSLRMKEFPGFEWIIDFWSARAAGWLVMAMICLWSARKLKLRFWENAREMIGQAKKNCRQCGYDLRGTRMAGRRECPECGTRLGGENERTGAVKKA
jgi:predicted RNA-binding Zn-ribbon protein involved in translation (DUF1610 family)